PAGMVNSTVTCIAESDSESVQAGFGVLSGGAHAGLWRGTRESWTDLHPDGADESYVFGTALTQQWGFFRTLGYAHACVWEGTAASPVDLHAVLPPRFLESYAQAMVERSDGTVVVVGDAFDPQANRTEAIVWTSDGSGGPGPCPGDLNGDR